MMKKMNDVNVLLDVQSQLIEDVMNNLQTNPEVNCVIDFYGEEAEVTHEKVVKMIRLTFEYHSDTYTLEFNVRVKNTLFTNGKTEYLIIKDNSVLRGFNNIKKLIGERKILTLNNQEKEVKNIPVDKPKHDMTNNELILELMNRFANDKLNFDIEEPYIIYISDENDNPIILFNIETKDIQWIKKLKKSGGIPKGIKHLGSSKRQFNIPVSQENVEAQYTPNDVKVFPSISKEAINKIELTIGRNLTEYEIEKLQSNTSNKINMLSS